MKHEIDVKWMDNMSFKTEVFGHEIIMDANEKAGGNNQGPPPKPLMLVALAGCTGMDVISILKKMRQDVESFELKIEGELTDDHPKKYKKIKVIYQLKGKNIDKEKVDKAVDLSKEKYCGVSAVYKEAIDMEFEVSIID
jgi:putative redox protein